MKKIEPRFLDIIPDNIESGILYISAKYNTAIHMCPCGCGNEIVTPFSPHDWKLIFDGDSISLYPSIGNWSLPCQSHYWIVNSEIEWAPKWGREEIEKSRKEAKFSRGSFFEKKRWPFLDF